MEEYRIGNAIVRVRGTVDKKELEEAAKIFFKKIDKQRRKKEKRKGKARETVKRKSPCRSDGGSFFMFLSSTEGIS